MINIEELLNDIAHSAREKGEWSEETSKLKNEMLELWEEQQHHMRKLAEAVVDLAPFDYLVDIIINQSIKK
jgi:hypothetical protein